MGDERRRAAGERRGREERCAEGGKSIGGECKCESARSSKSCRITSLLLFLAIRVVKYACS